MIILRDKYFAEDDDDLESIVQAGNDRRNKYNRNHLIAKGVLAAGAGVGAGVLAKKGLDFVKDRANGVYADGKSASEAIDAIKDKLASGKMSLEDAVSKVNGIEQFEKFRNVSEHVSKDGFKDLIPRNGNFISDGISSYIEKNPGKAASTFVHGAGNVVGSDSISEELLKRLGGKGKVESVLSDPNLKKAILDNYIKEQESKGLKVTLEEATKAFEKDPTSFTRHHLMGVEESKGGNVFQRIGDWFRRKKQVNEASKEAGKHAENIVNDISGKAKWLAGKVSDAKTMDTGKWGRRIGLGVGAGALAIGGAATLAHSNAFKRGAQDKKLKELRTRARLEGRDTDELDEIEAAGKKARNNSYIRNAAITAGLAGAGGYGTYKGLEHLQNKHFKPYMDVINNTKAGNIGKNYVNNVIEGAIAEGGKKGVGGRIAKFVTKHGKKGIAYGAAGLIGAGGLINTVAGGPARSEARARERKIKEIESRHKN